jgi:DNA polymerase III subunit alpha
MFKDLTIFGPHNHPMSLDSGNSVDQFITAAAVDFGRKAIAVTDHGTLSAIIEAQEISKTLKKKKDINITVVPGVELYLLPMPWDDSKHAYYHLTVHFDDFESYLHACKLSKPAFDRSVFKGGELKPLTTWEELQSMSGKVTMFSGCMVSPCMRPILKDRKDVAEKYFELLKNIAGPGRFFAELFPYEVSKNWNGKTKKFEPVKNECVPDGRLQVACNEWIMHLSQKYDVPMVVSEDAHYAHESEKPIQDLRLNKNGYSTWKMSDANCLHTTEWLYEEMKRLHPDKIDEKFFREMVDNSWKSFENFKGMDAKFKFSLPVIDIGHTCSPTCSAHQRGQDDALVEYVIKLVLKKNRINLNDKVYFDRLKKEMDALAYNGKVNLMTYFLVLEEVVDWCSKNDVLVGPGRGSAAGCLLSYGLGITSVDPIKEDLSFERFFDVSRVEEGLADIDTDFSDRNKVVDFLKERWGDKFAYLGIGSTFKTKSALKDIDRLLYGEVRPETDAICKNIPQSPQGVIEEDFLRGYKDADGNYVEGELEHNEKLKDYLNTNQEAAQMLFKMVGIIRQMGRHAAGVLIADKPVDSFIPVMKVSGEFTTQLLPKWVEKCGGVKYDILGVSTLEDIRLALKFIKERHGIEIDPWKIEDHPEMWEHIAENPQTIFQLHTDTVNPGLRSMRPKTVQEAALLTSVFRPGAMDAPSPDDPSITMEKVFLNRWSGRRKFEYTHPDLETILGPTKGVVIYQEQIMAIANQLGGLTMPETQKLRKAISKKASDDLIALLNKVRDNLTAKGWTSKQAEDICNQMKASGRYAFNKSHAVAYCYIARACAFLMWKYRAEWWAAVLTNADKDDLKSYWPTASAFTRLPDINRSGHTYIITPENELLSPLDMIDGIGPAAFGEILSKRPFKDFDDLLTRVDRRVINKRVIIKLIFSGCLNGMMPGDGELEKIQYYLTRKASLEGKKKIEQIPDEYRRLTPLKRELINKSVFKVYSADFLTAALPNLLKMGLVTQNGSLINLNINDPYYEGSLVVGKKTYQDFMEDSTPVNINFGIVGYVAKEEEVKYKNGTHTMKKYTIELEDLILESVKWPDWGKKHHGVDKDLTETVCLFIMNKRANADSVSIKKIIPIEMVQGEENEQ